MEDMEDKVIWSRDSEGRAILEDAAAFDALITGKINLTRTLHRILVEEAERLQSNPKYKRWKKERLQT